ncbi:TetR family transcriptional regulator [Microbispora oryzae]|nr:TetR family transcriptional regulator [Microbispora oryzae]
MTVGTAERGGRSPERRRELLDAADRVIRREGPEASMAAIAAEAGITKPILYRHFGDKSGLYQALAERHTRRVIDMLRPEFARAMDDPRARARAAVGTYLDTISAHPNLYRFLFHRASAEDSRTHTRMTAVVRGVGEELAAVLAEEGAADPVRAQLLGHAFVGMVRAIGDWWLDSPGLDRDAVVDGVADVIAGALGA